MGVMADRLGASLDTQASTREFGAWMASEQKRIFLLCRRLLQDVEEADSATQDAFLKAWQALNRTELRELEDAGRWLTRILPAARDLGGRRITEDSKRQDRAPAHAAEISRRAAGRFVYSGQPLGPVDAIAGELTSSGRPQRRFDLWRLSAEGPLHGWWCAPVWPRRRTPGTPRSWRRNRSRR